jgi:phosphatidate cytidylyltransferase
MILLTWHMSLALFHFQPISHATLNRLSLHCFGFLWIGLNTAHATLILRWSVPSLSSSSSSVVHASSSNSIFFWSGGVLALMLWTSWIGDAAAYYIGSRYGFHKIFSNVSPKKSLEGATATLVFSVLLCLLATQLQSVEFFKFPPIATVHYIMLGLIIGLFDILGDATESFVKRLGNVKDSSTFFTGHGGIMDRFDSFYIVCPLTTYYVWFVLVPLLQ